MVDIIPFRTDVERLYSSWYQLDQHGIKLFKVMDRVSHYFYGIYWMMNEKFAFVRYVEKNTKVLLVLLNFALQLYWFYSYSFANVSSCLLLLLLLSCSDCLTLLGILCKNRIIIINSFFSFFYLLKKSNIYVYIFSLQLHLFYDYL